MEHLILALNPGSTSTKFGLFKDEKCVFEQTIRHSAEELSKFEKIADQFEFREKAIKDYLEKINFDFSSLAAIVGRGGALKPIKGGVYKVNDALLRDLHAGVSGEHAANLGGIIANKMAKELGIPSFIADPPVVDEMKDIARVTGLKGFERKSKFHALNQKAVSKRFAKEQGKKYEDINLVVAHLGGGISVGAHEKGQVIDVTDALLGDGAFSPDRSGGLPTDAVIELCFSGNISKREVIKKLVGSGGIYSYFGTNDMKEISKRQSEGDQEAKLIYEAMAYQVAKDIGAMSTVLSGKVDQIILTGGIANDEAFVELIKQRVSYIADITVYPGESELEALALVALRVLKGEEDLKEYV